MPDPALSFRFLIYGAAYLPFEALNTSVRARIRNDEHTE